MTAVTFLGPYDVTSYATWEAAITATAATSAQPIYFGSNVVFAITR
jgi:hypothetical protein